MADTQLLPKLAEIAPGVPDPWPWAMVYRLGHLLQRSEKEFSYSRQLCISLYVFCYRDEKQRLREFVASEKEFFSLVGGYITVQTIGKTFIPTRDNLIDPQRMMTYRQDHPGFKRSFMYKGDLRKAMALPTKRENFKEQRLAIRNAQGLHCFHPMCTSAADAEMQIRNFIPGFPMCVHCYSKVKLSHINNGATFYSYTGLPKSLNNSKFLKWIDRPVLCALMCVKHVSERYSLPVPQGLSPEALRPLGKLIQYYPHGFSIPKTPEMLLLAGYDMAEVSHMISLKYFPPNLKSPESRGLLRTADEKGCVRLDAPFASMPIMVQKTWCERMYCFAPSYFMHKMPDGRLYLLSCAYCKVAKLVKDPTFTFHVIVDEPTENAPEVSMDAEWESYHASPRFATKCADSACGMLRDTEFPLCSKCGPTCVAPFCEAPAMSSIDTMCKKCGGGFKATIRITNAHRLTFAEMSGMLEKKVNAARRRKAKLVQDKTKRMLKALNKQVPPREAQQLTDAYEKDLLDRPDNFQVEVKGCAITKTRAVPPMWDLFFVKMLEAGNGGESLYVHPFVHSAKDNAAFLFLLGSVTSPDKPDNARYSNYYDPGCCINVKKEDVDVYNSLEMPNLIFSAYAQHGPIGAAAMLALTAPVQQDEEAAVPPEEIECPNLWSDSDTEEGGQDSKRAKTSKE